jgi:rhamnogalacturonan endolyase
MNFRIYWDGDLQDELLDDTNITKYGGSTLGVGSTPLASLGSPASCNSTKATPCLSADIFGDWREEVILWSKTDNATLNIYSTITTTKYRVPTLMHDHTYRMGICWQNTAYNQPPHLGYYLPDYVEGKLTNGLQPMAMPTRQTREVYDLQGRKQNGLKRGLNIIREGGRIRKVFY